MSKLESNKKSEFEEETKQDDKNDNSSLMFENELVIENESEPSENYSFADFINQIESFQPRNIDKFGNNEIKESLISEINENRIIKTELRQINFQVIILFIFLIYFNLESFRNS